MRVSAKAEYACVALVELAAKHRAGQPLQIKTIAEAHRISPRFLVQILIQLKGAGLVTSSRGAAGGYVLARPPETITLADIIHTIDPIPEATRDTSTTALECLRDIWKELNDSERRILENTTLAELVLRTQARDNSTYQI